MAHYLDEIDSNLLAVKNKLRNQIIKQEIQTVFQSIDFDFEELVNSINWYIKNIKTLQETDEVELVSAINNELKRLINFTQDKKHIQGYHIQLLDSINFLLEHSSAKDNADTSSNKMI